MRKIIMYASISWDAKDWKKDIAWVDHDLDPMKWRGSPKYALVQESEVIEDKHIMFVLEAIQAQSEITITPLEREAETQHIKINRGWHVYVGNGFLYWDTDREVK